MVIIGPAADTIGRPAINAPKQSSAKAIVNTDTVFSLTPRTRPLLPVTGTIASFGNSGPTWAIVALRLGFLFADSVLGIISLRFAKRVEAAATATTASQASWDATPGRICAVGARRARKSLCDRSPGHFRNSRTNRDIAVKASGTSRPETS